MGDKTQKIAEELHRLLKTQAAKEGRTLQEITEELLRDGLERKSKKANRELQKPGR